jgi:hypothetical protein
LQPKQLTAPHSGGEGERHDRMQALTVQRLKDGWLFRG